MPAPKKPNLDKYKGIRLDIGCGANKNHGFVGIDYHQYGDVDIVHNIEITPWPLDDESVLVATASHLLEHIDPHPGDARLQGLVDLLLKKHLITKTELDQHLGDPGPPFMKVMNEVWRVLKPQHQFAFVVPYAGSPGFFQDPTHCNNISEATLYYFDPLHSSQLYQFYEPAPWEIEMSVYKPEGNLEVVLRKRLDDRSYHKDEKIHWGKG